MSLEEVVLTTCPRDCYDGCGIAVVKRNGRVHKVVGDRNHPVSRGSLCGKCALAYNGVWRDANARLSQPLRRIGKKGEGRFEAISWEAALEEIAGRLHTCVERTGPSSILHTHYTGTCSLLAGEFPMRFFNRLGATEVDPDTICNNAGHAALGYVLGTSIEGFDPKTAPDSACIVLWGVNPSATAPHYHKFWLKEASAPVIVVDPVAHETARSATHHLQLRPGTDAALAFAMLHVAWRDNLLDQDFIDAHTLGWEELLPSVRECTPQWAAAICDLPAEQIVEVARLYAQGPSLLWVGQGLQRQPKGGNIMRACASLPAATGNMGKPGAGLYYLSGSGPRNLDGDYVTQPGLRSVPAESLSHMDLVERLCVPDKAAALISWNMNIAASAPQQRRLGELLSREDLFTVVIDLFATDTTDYADIVLPAASFLEFDDLVTPYFAYFLSAQVKAEEPPGSALPNQEIFRRLARAMRFSEASLYESDRDVIDTVLGRSGLDVDFDTLKEKGTIDPWPQAVIPFADGRYPTPSGRIELASERAQRHGHPRTALPLYDPRPAAGEFRLLSPASVWQLNDSYGNDERIRKALGPGSVLLNHDDLRALGINDGDTVEVYNDTGSLALLALGSDVVPSGVALSHKGRWLKHEATRGNVNVLYDGTPSDIGRSTAVHGTVVKIRLTSV